jgi:hypothetical protein
LQNDLWYTWTADCNGPATFETCDNSGEIDTLMTLYSGGTGTCICPSSVADQKDCSDDGCVFSGRGSRIVWSVVQGTCYTIRIGGFLGVKGQGVLHVTGCRCVSAPDCNDNNECTDDVCTTGLCSNPPVANGTACTDNTLFCDGVESCQAGVCASPGNPCVPPTPVCNETTNTCGSGGGGPPKPVVDPTGLIKSRFISFSVPSGSGSTALRVKLMSLHNVIPAYPNPTNLPIPFTLFQGQSQYVGPPVQYTESGSDPTAFMASTLQCTPYYQDWSTISLLHVTGQAIIPSSSYDVENVDSGGTASAALTIATARFGDVIINGVANFPDIQAEVAKYQNKAGAPIKARSKLSTTNTRGLISIGVAVGFADISADVAAYQGKPYPYNPGKCQLAPTTACKSDADCGANGPCVLECVGALPCVCP